MTPLLKYFLRGCLVVVPITVTLYTVYFLVHWFDALVGFPIPGVGFLLALFAITLVGKLTSSVFGKRLVALPDQLLARVPFVKLLYTSLRDLMAALVGERKTFDRPVIVSLDESGALRALGFVTRDDLAILGLSEHVAVYLPQSVNFAGQLLLVRRERITPVAMPPSELVPMIISAGVAG